MIRLSDSVRAGDWSGVPQAVAPVGVGGFLALLLALFFIRPHLCVAGGVLEFSWRLGPFTLRRQCSPLAEIVSVASESDDGSSSLRIKTARWEATFGGSDIGSETLDAVAREIERRCPGVFPPPLE